MSILLVYVLSSQEYADYYANLNTQSLYFPVERLPFGRHYAVVVDTPTRPQFNTESQITYRTRQVEPPKRIVYLVE